MPTSSEAPGSSSDPRPTTYLIAGPNGAGKTTFAVEYLPGFAECREFLNADLIAAGLSPFAPETQAMRAGRLLLTRVAELAAAGQNFGFESTLAGRTHLRLIADLQRQHGYRVVLFFLWLPTADFAVERVAGRVREGGHNIPEPVIRRRFEAGLVNFLRDYAPLVDSWNLYDGSREPPTLVASRDGETFLIGQSELYQQIRSRWGA